MICSLDLDDDDAAAAADDDDVSHLKQSTNFQENPHTSRSKKRSKSWSGQKVGPTEIRGVRGMWAPDPNG